VARAVSGITACAPLDVCVHLVSRAARDCPRVRVGGQEYLPKRQPETALATGGVGTALEGSANYPRHQPVQSTSFVHRIRWLARRRAWRLPLSNERGDDRDVMKVANELRRGVMSTHSSYSGWNRAGHYVVDD